MHLFEKSVWSILCLVFFTAGCAGVTTVYTPITDLYDPMYNPVFDYFPTEVQAGPSGYTIGIIDMAMSCHAVPPESFKIYTDLEKQYVADFSSAVSNGLEKIMTSKNITVAGPFESYEEMTFPERSRCDFLVQPVMKITFMPSAGQISKLEGYGGPNGESWKMGARKVDVNVRAEMDYVIFDPLTREKLERHKLRTDKVTSSYRDLYAGYVNRDEYGNIVKEYWDGLYSHRDSFPGYHNGEVAVGILLDGLYAEFLPQVDKFVSIEELKHLDKYKKELKDMKRY